MSYGFDAVGSVLAQSNTLANPIIYFCVDERFRKSLYSMFYISSK